MDLGLKGKRAIVTGGSKGIGRRCADIFADEGAHVAICARNPAEVEATVAALRAKGVTALRRGARRRRQGGAGGLGRQRGDGAGRDRHRGRQCLARWPWTTPRRPGGKQFEIDMHAHGAHRERGHALLEKSEAPSIVIVSSVSGREVDFTGPAYGATKAALIHYAQGLAYKLAPKMIRVNTVSPGNTYFEGGIWQWIEKNNPDLFKQALALNPTGRMATAEEVARGVVFLASPASSFTTGTNLVIDGALTKGVQF